MVYLCKSGENPSIHPLIQEISYIHDYDLENGVKVTKTVAYLKPVKMVYPLKSEEYPSICSRNISFLAIKSTLQYYDLENGVKVTKTVTYLKPVKMIYPLKSDEYPSICSRNISFLAIKSTFGSGRRRSVAPSVGHLIRKSGVLGSIPGLATYFRFSFHFCKKGSCQLLAKVCA